MSTSTRTPEPAPRRQPIGTVRISTVALLGIVAAVGVPAVAAAIVLSGTVDSKTKTDTVLVTDQVSKIVIADQDGSVRVTGDPTMFGVSGSAHLNWHGFTQAPLKLDQVVSNGVLTITKVCLRSDCGGADIDLRVPPNVAVQATTSNGGIEVYDVTGAVNLVTTNASITGHGLGSGDATFHTSNGSIEAGFSGAPQKIRAETSNASVRIDTDGRTPYFDDVHTSNGDTRLDNPQDRRSDNVIYIRTTNASVRVK